MVEEKADLGIAYDGDGDRVGFIDEKGNFIENDSILAIFSQYLLANKKGTIVYDSKCSLVVEEEISRLGGSPLMARSGHAFVKNQFLKNKALLAGELSGHFFWQQLQFDDGIFSSLIMAELLGENKITLSQLNKKLPHYLITPDIRLSFSHNPEDIIRKIAKDLSHYPLSFIDGVRIQPPDCWAMVRSSITEPILTFRFEGKTQEKLSFIIQLVLTTLPAELKREVEKRLPKPCLFYT